MLIKLMSGISYDRNFKRLALNYLTSLVKCCHFDWKIYYLCDLCN